MRPCSLPPRRVRSFDHKVAPLPSVCRSRHSGRGAGIISRIDSMISSVFPERTTQGFNPNDTSCLMTFPPGCFPLNNSDTEPVESPVACAICSCVIFMVSILYFKKMKVKTLFQKNEIKIVLAELICFLFWNVVYFS